MPWAEESRGLFTPLDQWRLGFLRRSVELACVFFVVLFVLLPAQRDALVDDFEEDFWLPFTHFHLGDRATAGYSDILAHSGRRSYRVAIHGWTVRDFGSAYGYAVFSTRSAPLGELRLAMLYDSLQDTVPSPWDAFTAGIALELLDARHASLGTYRYVTAYRASQNAGRCAPTLSDVVLDDQPELYSWIDVGRNPSADFPAAPWRSAAYVKVAVGFLCASGLTGASYGMYFDDFVLESDTGDADGDGLRDLEEETRVYAVQLSDPDVPIVLAPPAVTISLVGPRVSGDLVSGVVALDLVHPQPDDLSVSLVTRNGTQEETRLLWDPGPNVRGVAVTSPRPGESVRGTVLVTGRVGPAARQGGVRLSVDGVAGPFGSVGATGDFAVSWSTEGLAEGPHGLKAEVVPQVEAEPAVASSEVVPIVVDRTPPDLSLFTPGDGSTVSGLLTVSAGAYDAVGVDSVALFVDDARVDARDTEPFDFVVETADLPNTDHGIEVRASDAAGNTASRTITVRVSNRASAPPPPCYPACNLTGGTTVGNLAPVRTDARAWGLTVASGDRLDVSEGLQVPWHTQVVRTADGVSLILDAVAGGPSGTAGGVVASNLTPESFLGSGLWRIVVRDHGASSVGFISRASVRFAVRTSPVLADTDGDGLSDGVERSMPKMSPVIADLDGDGLTDAWESVPHTLTYTVDGVPRTVTIKTDPLEPDTDHDGLNDGEELAPPPGWNVTNPCDPDTDGDGLRDGVERHTYETDPTRTDTDADGLPDGFEVTPHTMTLVVDGVSQERTVVTDPLRADTDDDGLTDWQEWNGATIWGMQTDPSDPDTDRDGLNDGDEIRGTNRRPTNPLRSDSDGDGLIDGIDLAPTETWSFGWTHSFDPGLVRFTQRFRALDVHGTYAGIWTYDPANGDCVFLSEHTADATKSSDESAASVGSWINKTFLQGGERNYTSLGMSYAGLEGWGGFHYERGECSATAPRKYIIEYTHDNHLWDVDFVNVAPVNVTDEEGTKLYHATIEIPLVPDAFQNLILQVSLPPDADRGTRVPGGVTVVPAIQYGLYGSRDFLAAPPAYRSIALGAPIDNHSYQFVLRIPKDAAKHSNGFVRGTGLYAILDMTPVWLQSAYGTLSKAALNATRMTVGAAVTKVERLAERVMARLSVNLSALYASLPASAEGLEAGVHPYGPYTVYLHRLGGAFDDAAAQAADAVWLSGETEEEVASFQGGLTWTTSDAWTRDGRDAFGLDIGIMKIIRRGISLTSQLTAGLVATSEVLPPWIWTDLTYSRSFLTATTLESTVTWSPIYVVSSSGTRTFSVVTFGPDIGYPTTESYSLSWELGNAEMVDDLDDSVMLAGARNFNLRAGLQAAAIGTTLVVFGSQAILAYAEGDSIRGTIFLAAGGLSVFGIVKSQVILSPRLFEGGVVRGGVTLRLGAAAALAVGAILASYEVYLATVSSNSIGSLAHYETAGTTFLDAGISIVPLYGPALSLGWQLGLGLSVAVQDLLGILPDRLAARLTSSPGSTIVFLFEYVLGGEIPSAIAEDALVTLLSALNDAMRFLNLSGSGTPTVVVAP